jgi:uncharacterized protein YjiS (DUF1127 family)
MRFSNPITPLIDVHGWFRAAIERRELLAMDDRMLRDIGMTRTDAKRIAETPYQSEGGGSPAPWHPVIIDRDVIDAHIARAHRLRNAALRDAFLGLLRRLRTQPKARIRKLAPVAR